MTKQRLFRYPTLKTLCFRVNSIYRYKVCSSKGMGCLVPLIPYGNIYEAKLWSTLSNAFFQSINIPLMKDLLPIDFSNIFSNANYCLQCREMCLKSKLFLYRTNWSFKSSIAPLRISFLLFFQDEIAERWVYS